MTNMRVTLNGDVLMDGDLGQWSTNPPPLLAEQLKAHTTPKPWMRAIMLTIADAATSNQSTTIDVTTRSNRWDLHVEYT